MHAPTVYTERAPMRIAAVLSEQTVLLRIRVGSKTELLNRLIDVLPATGKVRDLEEVRRVIFQREQQMTTCIGGGIALPHGKTRAVAAPVAALATLKPPVELDAPDCAPVEIAFLLVGDEDHVGTHLRLLSRASRLLSNPGFRAQLLQVQTPQEVLRLFEHAEALTAQLE